MSEKSYIIVFDEWVRFRKRKLYVQNFQTNSSFSNVRSAWLINFKHITDDGHSPQEFLDKNEALERIRSFREESDKFILKGFEETGLSKEEVLNKLKPRKMKVN